MACPQWLAPRGKRTGRTAPEQEARRGQLEQYYRTGPTFPDAWVHPETHELAWEPRPQLLPLVLGDVVQYPLIDALANLMPHEMVYVGAGCVVGFSVEARHYGGTPALDIQRLDELKTPRRLRVLPNTWTRAQADALFGRAMECLGPYRYNPVHFNCQHVIHRLLGRPGWESSAVDAGLALIIALGVALLLAVGVLLGRKTNPK